MTPRASRHASTLGLRAALALLLALLAAPGCLMLPVPTPEHGLVTGTGVVPEAETRLLETGRTTREDVLLHFGQPALTRCGERVLVYHWAVAHGWLIVVVGGPGAAAVAPIPIPKSYLVVFAFDADGRLAHVDRGTDLFAYAPDPESWLPADCADPPTPPPARKTLAGFLEVVPGGAVEAEVVLHAGSILTMPSPLAVRIEPFADARRPELEPNHLVAGRFETAPFGVWSWRPASDLLRAAVAGTWLAAGHALVDDEAADLVVEGRIDRLDLDVDWNWITATERTVALELSLRVRHARDRREFERRYTASAREPSRWRGDPALEWGAALSSALEQLAESIATDAELAGFLAGS